MKKQFVEIIPKMLFLSLSGILLLFWLNSFLGGKLEDLLKGVIPFNELPGQEAFASEKDVKEKFGYIDLYYDTLYVLDTTAEKGDTFWVTVSLTNTIPVAGASVLLTYDKTIISPLYYVYDPCGGVDTTCTTYAVKPYKTYRTTHEIPDTCGVGGCYYVWAAYAPNYHLDTLYFNFASLDPGNMYLRRNGSGPIARFLFVVSDTVSPERETYINFILIDPVTHLYANTLVDTIGLDMYIPRIKGGKFTVAGGGPPVNHFPAFALSMPEDAYQVNEGQTLQFQVKATDQDGDVITLSLVSFTPSPPGGNYHFRDTSGVGSVTQTFDYTPEFGEGGVVRTATFRATDEHDSSTTKTVAITVIETPQDRLITGSQEGGVPGSTGILVPFWITNTVDIYGFQFTFRWDATKLDVDSIVPTSAINGFTMYTNLGDSAGKATVLVFGLASQTIPAGLDTVVYAAFSVHSDAPSVEVPITLENAREAINPGYPSKSLVMMNGKFTIDKFGDVNIDRLVDVADIVSLVAYILGYISFNSRQTSASDINQDLAINVGDLVAMIDIILGRWMGPSPPQYPGPMAKVSLDYNELQPGSLGEVKVMADLEVPVAGAQFLINYDPNMVSFQAPRLSERSEHFLAEYRDDGRGKLKVVLYNLSNDPIPAGEGNILSLPAMVKPGAGEGFKLELKEVVLSDEKAVLLPVEGESPSVPVAFELSQNYPNPFNPSTSIQYTVGSIQTPIHTTLRIYNVRGQLVRTLVDEQKTAGTYEVIWDGKDDQGNLAASGIYFYKLRAGDYQDTKKMVLMK